MNRREVETHFGADEPAPVRAAVDKGRYRWLHDRALPSDNIVGSGVIEVQRKRAWRPYKYYREASKRRLTNVADQFRTSTRTDGLKSSVRNNEIWVVLRQDAFKLLPNRQWGRV